MMYLTMHMILAQAVIFCKTGCLCFDRLLQNVDSQIFTQMRSH